VILRDRPATFRSVMVEPIQNLLNVQGESFNILCEGKQSIGKSGSMITLCKAVDSSFDETRMVFTTKQYVELLKESKMPVGSAYLFDECGDELGSRSAMRPDQRRLMAVKQADRILGLLGAFTLPKGTMADKQLRQLAHCLMEGVAKDRNKGMACFKYKLNSFRFNWRTSEPIYTFPLVLRNHVYSRCTRVWIPKPPKNLWRAYGNLKLENLNRLYEGVLQKKDLIESKTQQINRNPEAYRELMMPLVNEVLANKEKFLSDRKEGERFSPDKIRTHLTIPIGRAREVSILARELLNRPNIDKDMAKAVKLSLPPLSITKPIISDSQNQKNSP
jgi:hypothetical protein